jgi:hypothetical protein
MDYSAYKISLTIPASHKDILMDAVNSVMQQIYPGYDRVFSITETKGTWRPLKGSDPFIGRVGEVTVEDEVRIDFAVKAENLKKVIIAIKEIHPYEEPAIDIMPLIPWKDVIDL